MTTQDALYIVRQVAKNPYLVTSGELLQAADNIGGEIGRFLAGAALAIDRPISANAIGVALGYMGCRSGFDGDEYEADPVPQGYHFYK